MIGNTIKLEISDKTGYQTGIILDKFQENGNTYYLCDFQGNLIFVRPTQVKQVLDFVNNSMHKKLGFEYVKLLRENMFYNLANEIESALLNQRDLQLNDLLSIIVNLRSQCKRHLKGDDDKYLLKNDLFTINILLEDLEKLL